MEIKTALEILAEVMNIHPEPIKDDKGSISDATFKEIEKAMVEYATQFIDYASENVEVHSNQLSGFMKDDLEVYIPKGEFNKIKELIK